jgi:hypothetical protein
MKLKRFLLTILFVFALSVGFLGLGNEGVWALEENERCSGTEDTRCEGGGDPQCIGGPPYGYFCRDMDKVAEQFAKDVSRVPELNVLNKAIETEDVNLGKLTNTNTLFGATSILKEIIGSGKNAITTKSGETQAVKQSGAIQGVGKAIATIMGSSPASGQTYVADLMYNAKFLGAPPAYAQVGGLGFSSLEPILEAWKQFRNIAYMFFIIITVVIGFMIMMRQKIGGQAAVTAQQAIPNIVIALIAVTFSYAVAGFLIDFMYLSMYLLVGLFSSQITANAINYNIVELGGKFITGDVLGTSHTAVEKLVEAAFGDTNNPIEELFGFGSGLIFAIVIAFAMLFALASLFFELLKTYIAIIINIILSPLLLMMGALPGRTDIFKNWVRSLVGNLMAFPVVLLLLIIHRLLTDTSTLGGGFLPPYLIGRGNGGAIPALIGLAIMLISKDLVVQAKKAISPSGSGIFEQFGSALSSAINKGEAALPTLGGLGGATAGAIQGERIARQQGEGARGRIQGMIRGHNVDGQEKGGLTRYASKGFSAGQTGRKYLDRAKEGRIFDAEDPIKILSRLDGRNKKKEEKPPTSSVHSSS